MSDKLQNKMNIELVLELMDELHYSEFYDLIRYLVEDDENNFLDMIQWSIENSAFLDALFQSRKRWIQDL